MTKPLTAIEASVADLSTYNAAFTTTGEVSVRGKEQPPTHAKLPNETIGPIIGKHQYQCLHVYITVPFSVDPHPTLSSEIMRIRYNIN